MSELPWLIIKTSFALPECPLETSKYRGKETPLPKAPSAPWPQEAAKQWQMSDGQVTRASPWGASSQGIAESMEKKELFLPLFVQKSSKAFCEWI